MKLEKCPCGKNAIVVEYNHEFSIECPNEMCWRGPVKKSKSSAARTWNRSMAAVRKIKTLK